MDEPLPAAADLDPVRAEDVAAIRRLLEGGRREELPSFEFLDACAAGSPCPRLRGEARLLRGMLAQAGGDATTASRCYNEGLRTTWGSGGSIERRAVINYSILCINARRPLEAMLLARRGGAIGPADDFLAVSADLNLAGALLSLGATERAVGILRAADQAAAKLHGELRDYVDVVRSHYWIAAACESRDASMAHAALAQLEALGALETSELTMRCFRARVALVDGETEAGLRALLQVLVSERPNESIAAACELLVVEAHLALGQPEQALATAATLVARLEASAAGAIAPGNRLQTARVLATAIGRLAGADDLPRRALDVAATAAVERIWQADRFRRDLPGFEFLTGDDRELIDEIRERFTDAYGDVLSEVARFLGSGDELARLRAPDPSHQMIGVCAWCRRVRGPEGLWLDFGEFAPPEGTVQVTHGACEPCLEHTLAALEPAC